MKKIITLLLSILILVACSNTSTDSITNGNDIIFKGKDSYTFTKNDLFRSLKGVDYSYLLICNLVNKVAEIEKMDLDAYNKTAEENMEMYKQIYGLENFDSYGGEEGFKLQLVTDEIIADKTNNYIKENLETFATTDKPFKAQIAYFDDLESANKMSKQVSEGSSFDMAALENGYDYSTQATLYFDNDTTLPLEVKEFINTTNEASVSPVLTTTTSIKDADGNEVESPRYYLVNLISKDYKTFTDEYVEKKSTEVDNNEVLKYIFNGYDIKFYDSEAIKQISAAYPGVFE